MEEHFKVKDSTRKGAIKKEGEMVRGSELLMEFRCYLGAVQRDGDEQILPYSVPCPRAGCPGSDRDNDAERSRCG